MGNGLPFLLVSVGGDTCRLEQGQGGWVLVVGALGRTQRAQCLAGC